MPKMAPEATWRPGAPEPGDLYLQNQKLCVCIDKSQLLLGITYTVSLKIKPLLHVYANVSELPPPLNFIKFVDHLFLWMWSSLFRYKIR